MLLRAKRPPLPPLSPPVAFLFPAPLRRGVGGAPSMWLMRILKSLLLLVDEMMRCKFCTSPGKSGSGMKASNPAAEELRRFVGIVLFEKGGGAVDWNVSTGTPA